MTNSTDSSSKSIFYHCGEKRQRDDSTRHCYCDKQEWNTLSSPLQSSNDDTCFKMFKFDEEGFISLPVSTIFTMVYWYEKYITLYTVFCINLLIS